MRRGRAPAAGDGVGDSESPERAEGGVWKSPQGKAEVQSQQNVSVVGEVTAVNSWRESGVPRRGRVLLCPFILVGGDRGRV